MLPKDPYKIIILETNQVRRDYLKSVISQLGVLPFSFEKETMCLDNLLPINPDLIIIGLFPKQRAFRLLNSIKTINWSIPVLILGGDQILQDYVVTNQFIDVLVFKTGFQPADFEQTVTRVFNQRHTPQICQEIPIVLGNSPEMLRIKKLIPEVSRSREAILVRGETGTGRELVARTIRAMSVRRDASFVKINSASLLRDFSEQNPIKNRTNISSKIPQELSRVFKAAEFGTIFLDEVGEIPAAFQAQLLQIVEDGILSKTGCGKDRGIDIRIIASSSADFEKLFDKGRFRKDLYYRLNVFNIEIPPLRNRLEDVPMLTDFFTDKYCREIGRSHYELSPKTKDMFCSYHWPGNVSELENLVKSVVVLGREDHLFDALCLQSKKNTFQVLSNCCENLFEMVEHEDLTLYMQDLNDMSLKEICKDFMRRAETTIMKKTLESTNWNRKKAAMILDISYKSLLNKIKAYRLT
jgi:DNA-binding NtrC family response regulator